MPMQETMQIAAPTAPASGATAVLFNSETMFGVGVMRQLGLSLLELTWARLSHVSGTNGLKAYVKTTSGGTWRESTMPDDDGIATMPVTISAVTTSAVESERFVVNDLVEFKLEYTNSANTLTSWEVSIVATFNAAAVAR
jgi:hypothetical protein